MEDTPAPAATILPTPAQLAVTCARMAKKKQLQLRYTLTTPELRRMCALVRTFPTRVFVLCAYVRSLCVSFSALWKRLPRSSWSSCAAPPNPESRISLRWRHLPHLRPSTASHRCQVEKPRVPKPHGASPSTCSSPCLSRHRKNAATEETIRRKGAMSRPLQKPAFKLSANRLQLLRTRQTSHTSCHPL